jgi:cobalt-zinc-cadmium efflux system membrane fusion protein
MRRFFLSVALVLCAASPALAHEGEKHAAAPGTESAAGAAVGPIEVESLQLGDPPPRVQYSSPLGGVVTDRHVVVGDDVEPARHLFEVADLAEVLAIGRMFEGQIGQVSVGQKVRVRVPSYPDDVFEGLVERLGGKLEADSRSLAVYVRVPNSGDRLRPHMRATLSLVTGGAERALAIPKSAVLGEAGNFYAFVQDEDRVERFERRALVLGVADDRFIEVIEGLSPGDRVVSEGNYSLQYITPVVEEDEHANAAEANGHSERSWLAAVLWALGAFGLLVVAALGFRVARNRLRPAREVH